MRVEHVYLTRMELLRRMTRAATVPSPVWSVARREAGWGRTRTERALAWAEAVRGRVRYREDPPPEYVQSPELTWQLAAGDCDDVSLLVAAGLSALGVPWAWDTSRGHVWVVAEGDVPLEAAYRWVPLGRHPLDYAAAEA